MAVCYVVGAGECTSLPINKQNGDIIIAVDGGARHLEKFGLKPDVFIGDFDSLGEIPDGDNVISLKPEKDVTDMHAAVDEGIFKGYDKFEIFGATGGRLDHTLANIQLAVSLAQRGIKHIIHGEGYCIKAINDSFAEFDSSYNGYVSVFSHSDSCVGVSIEGLKYELSNVTLSNSFALGVSNEFIGKKSKISVKKGTLVIVYTNKKGEE